MREMLKKVLGVIFSFSGFLISFFVMFVLGKREGKLKQLLKESEREKEMIKRGRKKEEELKNEFEKVETPEEALRMYHRRTGSYTR